jgi:hypothetical protein
MSRRLLVTWRHRLDTGLRQNQPVDNDIRTQANISRHPLTRFVKRHAVKDLIDLTDINVIEILPFGRRDKYKTTCTTCTTQVDALLHALLKLMHYFAPYLTPNDNILYNNNEK